MDFFICTNILGCESYIEILKQATFSWTVKWILKFQTLGLREYSARMIQKKTQKGLSGHSEFFLQLAHPNYIINLHNTNFTYSLFLYKFYLWYFSGYMAPEYASEGLFSIKSDVFSFGVLILEIVSGKRNSGFHQCGDFFTLLGYVSSFSYT